MAPGTARRILPEKAMKKMTKEELQEKHRAMIEKDHIIEHIEFNNKGYVKALKAVDKGINTTDLTNKKECR